MRCDNAVCFCVCSKEYVQPSKIAMQPLKRKWKFTHVSEGVAELRYWSCGVSFEILLCLVTRYLPLDLLEVCTVVLRKEKIPSSWQRCQAMLGHVVDGCSAEKSCQIPLLLCVFSTPVLTTYTTGMAFSCKCMTFQHRATGIWAAVKHTVLSKPLPGK